MRRATIGVAILWGVMALSLMARLSFASFAANAFAVVITVTAGLCLLVAWAWHIPYRAASVLATLVLSGLYLTGLWILGWGLVFYPWIRPDLEVRQGSLICRAVYHGEYTEVMVSQAYPLGIEKWKENHWVNGSSSTINCGEGQAAEP